RLGGLQDERHDVEAALGRLIDVVQDGLVVPDHDQLEGRRVGEEVPAQESRTDRIAAGQRLDARLGPRAALLRLARGDKTRAVEAIPVEPLAVSMAVLVAGGPWVRSAPGIPCASCSSWALYNAKPGQAMPRHGGCAPSLTD